MDSHSMGLSEMILVLLALGGFSAQPNPGAPAAAEVLRYAPDNADVVAHFDVEAVVPKNYEVFRHLPDAPTLKGMPEVQRHVAGVIAEAEKGLADVKSKSGIDMVHDVHSVSLFVTLKEQGPPDFLVAARGKFAPDFLAVWGKAATDKWKAEKVNGKPGLMSSDGMALATVAPDGTLLVGTPSWVRERAGGKWTPKANPVAPETMAALDEKPIFLVATRPRPEAARLIEREVGDPEIAFFKDLMLGQESAAYAVSWNGVWWSYTAKTAAGYQRAVMATDGIIQLMRAGHLGMRGFARVALALVDSYTAVEPNVATVAAHKDDLLRIVDTWSGDGSFNASVAKKDAARTVNAKLTGKSLSEVLPFAGVMVLGAMAWAVAR